MASNAAALRLIAQRECHRAKEQTSGDNAEQTVTIPAPGEGKALVLEGLGSHYSDGSHHAVEIAYTDRDGSSVTLTDHTGVHGEGGKSTPFPPNRFRGIVTQENTAITVTAEAAGSVGETSHIELIWSVVEEWVLAEILEQVDG